jgi:FSR family fosmidomycin resistance protein-like MFS transporter
MLSIVSTFPTLLIASGLIGVGSSTFHLEGRAWRAWHRATLRLCPVAVPGGGNVGSALGPLLAAAVIVGRGQGNIAHSAAMCNTVLYKVSHWYRGHRASFKPKAGGHGPNLSRNKVMGRWACWPCWCSRNTSTWPACRAITRFI